MSHIRKALILLSAVLSLLAAPVVAGQAGDGISRLAIQISDNDPATFNKALNVATNFARGMSEKGDFYEIEIVTFNAGLHMLRSDTSPVLDRIQSISESIPEVTFSACGNTIAGINLRAALGGAILDNGSGSVGTMVQNVDILEASDSAVSISPSTNTVLASVTVRGSSSDGIRLNAANTTISDLDISDVSGTAIVLANLSGNTNC